MIYDGVEGVVDSKYHEDKKKKTTIISVETKPDIIVENGNKLLTRGIALGMYQFNNVKVVINPLTRNITMEYNDDKSKWITNEKEFGSVEDLDMNNVIKMYREESKRKNPKKLSTKEIAVGEQMALMVSELWLKFGHKEVCFDFDVNTNIVKMATKFKSTQEQYEQLSSSFKQTKTNDNGLFWKREWLKNQDKKQTTGGGKV